MIGFEKLNRAATDALGRLVSRPREMTGGLLLAILVVTHAAVWLVPSVFQPMQDQFIDRLFRLRERVPALLPDYDGTAFLVPIDDESVQRRDGFYLGREDYGRLIRNLHRAGVSAQFLDVIFAAPETEEGDRLLAEALTEADSAFVGMAIGASPHDRGESPEVPNALMAEILARQRWTDVEVLGGTEQFLKATRYFTTFPGVAATARGMGHLDLIPDRDGVMRRVPLLVRDGDGFLPSLHLLVLTTYLDIRPAEIRIEPGRVILRDIVIPVNARGEMRVNFRGAWGALQTYPFSSVYTASDDRFMMEDLREELVGRIAVVSWFSTGRGDVGAVPTDPVYPRAGIWAEAMNTILTRQFVRELSGWQMLLFVELPLLLVMFFAATRLTTIPFVLSSVGLFLGYVLVVAGAFLWASVILNAPAPLIVLVASTPVIAAYQFHLESEKRAKINRELAVAREIQMGTFPRKMPQLEGYELVGHSVPADETGGDSFDVIGLEGERLMLLLGDATGHGIGPALSVVQVRSMLRVAMRLHADLDQSLTQINDQLDEDLASNRFVTAFLGLLDAPNHRVDYHSAGQGPLLLFRAESGDCESFGATATPLGMFSGFPPKPALSLDLAPGDILCLMTDGVFEQEDANGEQVGEERVIELIRRNRNAPASELLEALFALVREHRGAAPQSDDVTVLLVRRLPRNES